MLNFDKIRILNDFGIVGAVKFQIGTHKDLFGAPRAPKP